MVNVLEIAKAVERANDQTVGAGSFALTPEAIAQNIYMANNGGSSTIDSNLTPRQKEERDSANNGPFGQYANVITAMAMTDSIAREVSAVIHSSMMGVNASYKKGVELSSKLSHLEGQLAPLDVALEDLTPEQLATEEKYNKLNNELTQHTYIEMPKAVDETILNTAQEMVKTNPGLFDPADTASDLQKTGDIMAGIKSALADPEAKVSPEVRAAAETIREEFAGTPEELAHAIEQNPGNTQEVMEPTYTTPQMALQAFQNGDPMGDMGGDFLPAESPTLSSSAAPEVKDEGMTERFDGPSVADVLGSTNYQTNAVGADKLSDAGDVPTSTMDFDNAQKLPGISIIPGEQHPDMMDPGSIMNLTNSPFNKGPQCDMNMALVS